MPNIPVNDMTCVLYEYNLLKASQKWHVRMPQKFYSQSLLCILIMCMYGSSRNSEWTFTFVCSLFIGSKHSKHLELLPTGIQLVPLVL